MRGAAMTTWTIKSVTDDPDRALEIVQDQRIKGYTAWIEDENGRDVDEKALKIGKAELGKPTLYERGKGAAYFVAAAVAAFGTLYLLGLWVDH
jgi:hypothetical protein